jgi:hypothetical protein
MIVGLSQTALQSIHSGTARAIGRLHFEQNLPMRHVFAVAFFTRIPWILATVITAVSREGVSWPVIFFAIRAYPMGHGLKSSHPSSSIAD